MEYTNQKIMKNVVDKAFVIKIHENCYVKTFREQRPYD